jgi:hypothetical protein
LTFNFRDDAYFQQLDGESAFAWTCGFGIFSSNVKQAREHLISQSFHTLENCKKKPRTHQQMGKRFGGGSRGGGGKTWRKTEALEVLPPCFPNAPGCASIIQHNALTHDVARVLCWHTPWFSALIAVTGLAFFGALARAPSTLGFFGWLSAIQIAGFFVFSRLGGIRHADYLVSPYRRDQAINAALKQIEAMWVMPFFHLLGAVLYDWNWRIVFIMTSSVLAEGCITGHITGAGTMQVLIVAAFAWGAGVRFGYLPGVPTEALLAAPPQPPSRPAGSAAGQRGSGGASGTAGAGAGKSTAGKTAVSSPTPSTLTKRK